MAEWSAWCSLPPLACQPMRRTLLTLAPLLVVTACTPDPSEPGPEDALPAYVGDLTAIDDAESVEAFSVLRDTLHAVIARRDTTALLATIAPGARLSFGDTPGGPEGFEAMWFAGEEAEPVWDILDRILRGGCVEEDGAIVVPAIAALWPETLDPFAHVALLGDEVRALDAPGGTPLARLSRITLPITAPSSTGWQPIRLPDGTDAVVPAGAVLSPVGHRATFWDDGDGWRLQSFLSGD